MLASAHERHVEMSPLGIQDYSVMGETLQNIKFCLVEIQKVQKEIEKKRLSVESTIKDIMSGIR